MKNKIMIVGILTIVLAVFATTAVSANAPPVPPGDPGIYYLVPQDNSAPYCNSKTIEVWVNSSWEGHTRSGKVTIKTSDKTCANITSCWTNNTEWTQATAAVIKEGGGEARLTYSDTHTPINPPGLYPIGTITVHANSSASCLATLSMRYGFPLTYLEDTECGGESGTFDCEGAQVTHNQDLAEGWNLISLPLTSSNNSAAKVLENVSYDAVYGYSATPPKKFVSVGTMDPGVGYFVNVTAPDQTWTYSGTTYDSINVSLESGLNMVGWPNCSMNITEPDNALSSLLGKYNYVVRFNATSQRFEAYNPHAPPSAGFNDFDLMEPGTGYFISARPDCPRLVKDCPTP